MADGKASKELLNLIRNKKGRIKAPLLTFSNLLIYYREMISGLLFSLGAVVCGEPSLRSVEFALG